ncbi:MAG TPA: DUF4149 domain-containing protein [Pyrinomonadaceae bacterium]|nr:DUF4149 domain-containing protein [Pyrinomonadaceae bacterium]
MSVEVEDDRTKVAAADAAKTSERDGGGWLVSVMRDVRLLLIALWLGGAVFFSATVAPSAFGVLRARNVPLANEAAGSIVTRTLSIVNTGGFALALLLLASAFLFRQVVTRRAFLTETIALALVAVATAVGQWIIAARMLALRSAMGRPIDEVAADDSLRLGFNRLHGYSVMALGLAIVAAAVALLLIARRAGGQNPESGGGPVV